MLTLKVSSMLSKKATDPKIYLYNDMFEDNYCCKNVALKDIGAFKFYCIQDHLVSIVVPYAYIFPVSDKLYTIAILYVHVLTTIIIIICIYKYHRRVMITFLPML